MKNVMKRAWEIAREGQKKFGGKVKEYFVVALKLAWAEVKNENEKTEIYVQGDRRGKRTWVAQIVGRHPQYVLDRKFLTADKFDEDGYKYYYVTDGIYEKFNGKHRFLFEIKNGKFRDISRDEALFLVG